MNHRTEPGRDNDSSNYSVPSAPSRDDETHRNGRRGSTREDEHMTTDRSSSGKPALTDRERRERWPVD